MNVSITDYARHRKCTKKAVYDALRSGAIVVDGNGHIDIVAADSAWAANMLPEPAHLKASRAEHESTAPDSDEADGGESFNAARTRRERATASQAELALQQKRGELVAVVDVQRAWYGLVRASRDRLLGLPDRISADIASMADQHEVRVYLDREIRGALAELTDPAATTEAP